MRKIYSKINPDKLLHIIIRESDFSSGRTDIIPELEFLQASTLLLPKGKTFRPHKHIYKPGKKMVIAQESWVILHGAVKIFMYDIDDTLIATETLWAGQVSITLAGGHTYEILADNTKVIEYKTGPYTGQKDDKVFLDEQ